MQNIKNALLRRRKLGFFILLAIAIFGYIVDIYYPLTPPSYISKEWHMPLVYFLIAYKVIELGVFYLLFYRRHYLKLLEEQFHTHLLKKFEKNAKRFFFLVPQGSIVFGVLAYALSSEIRYLWLFLCIAALTLLLVNPRKLEE